MIGTMLVFTPHAWPPAVTSLTAPPGLQELQEKVGGWLEKVPNFHAIEFEGDWRPCVALCNEEGKLDRPKPLDVNHRATILWDQSLRHDGHPGLVTPFGNVADYLVGNIVVLVGDDEFMEAL